MLFNIHDTQIGIHMSERVMRDRVPISSVKLSTLDPHLSSKMWCVASNQRSKPAKVNDASGVKWLRDPIRTPLHAGPASKLSKALRGLKDRLKEGDLCGASHEAICRTTKKRVTPALRESVAVFCNTGVPASTTSEGKAMWWWCKNCRRRNESYIWSMCWLINVLVGSLVCLFVWLVGW